MWNHFNYVKDCLFLNTESFDMSSYTVKLNTAASEQAFLEFLENHADIEAVPNILLPNDSSVFDTNGEFQRINLATEGLPISSDYLEWRLKQSMDSVRISKEDFLAGIEKRKVELLKK